MILVLCPQVKGRIGLFLSADSGTQIPGAPTKQQLAGSGQKLPIRSCTQQSSLSPGSTELERCQRVRVNVTWLDMVGRTFPGGGMEWFLVLNWARPDLGGTSQRDLVPLGQDPSWHCQPVSAAGGRGNFLKQPLRGSEYPVPRLAGDAQKAAKLGAMELLQTPCCKDVSPAFSLPGPVAGGEQRGQSSRDSFTAVMPCCALQEQCAHACWSRVSLQTS